jgi:hypothetical protein
MRNACGTSWEVINDAGTKSAVLSNLISKNIMIIYVPCCLSLVQSCHKGSNSQKHQRSTTPNEHTKSKQQQTLFRHYRSNAA